MIHPRPIVTLTAAWLAVFPVVPSAPADEGWSLDGFDMPESAFVDTARDRIIVSVMGGHPGAVDGDGKLALVSRDGTLLDPAWVTGLNAPKGMAVVNGTPLVADLTQLHEIDLATGTLVRSIEAPEAVFLNDVASNGDMAYVSDLMTGRILHYSEGQLDVWLEAGTVAHPNGLLLDGDRLLVGGWGEGMRDDFTTATPGALHAVSTSDRAVATLSDGLGNLEGLTWAEGVLYASDWVAGTVLALDGDGTVLDRYDVSTGVADIAADGDTLLLPMMLDGRLDTMVPKPSE